MKTRARRTLALSSLLTTFAVHPLAADPPPAPLSCGPPPAAYTSLRHTTLTQGRAIAAEIAADDVKAVYARFSSQYAKLLSEDQVRQVLDGLRTQGTVGSRQGEGVLLGSPHDHFYVGDYRYLTGYLEIKIGFDEAGAVEYLLLTPRQQPPDPNASYQTKTRLRLPFEGQWWVFWGGDTEAQNYHVIAPDQRHAYDFCVWRDGGTHRGEGTQNSDYWAWGQQVVAPADATVIEAVDDVPDNTPGVMNPSAPAGNHVELRFGDGEFALIAHLQHDSLTVHPGDHVKTGQRLGLCGNSGNTSEPHVHMHLQDRPKLFDEAIGLPLDFENYRADGKAVTRGAPTQGQFICADGG